MNHGYSTEDNYDGKYARISLIDYINSDSLTLEELRDKAKITLVSAVSIVEGGAHDVQLKDSKK